MDDKSIASLEHSYNGCNFRSKETLNCGVKAVMALIYKQIKSLILAQDERWRRA
jgi:hypothetical protein